MNRRNFIYKAGLAGGTYLLATPFLSGGDKANKMSRIGMTTVVFRNRFRPTAGNNLTNELKLTDIPQFYSERFGIRNLEFWTKHFESRDLAYLKDVKSSILKNKCKLINIQGDSVAFDVSDTDEAKREPGIKEMKEWIDVGAFLGSKMVRVSIMKKSFDQARASVKMLVDYANKKGITLLVENHNDLFSVTENHIKIAKEFESRKFGLIADLGNFKADTDRFEALKMICPYTKLISAKVAQFDKDYNHISYDFDRCVRVMEEGGYKGIYSIEQWASGSDNYDYEKIVEWAIEHIKANI